MSRIAKNPIHIPKNVDVQVNQAEHQVSAKGPFGSRTMNLNPSVRISVIEGVIRVAPANDEEPNWAMAGTTRAILQNLVSGVATGFRVDLELRGVGYKARIDGKNLVLSLGFSHEIIHKIIDGIKIETPTQTTIALLGNDIQVLKQEAATIRSYRPPENYKGKGVRYLGEKVLIKETTKKK